MKFIKFSFASLFTFLLLTQSVSAVSCDFRRSLEIEDEGDDVKCLQQYLNNSGFTISTTGAGSPGKETDTFKSKTKDAIIKWQKANSIEPASGFFGPLSREVYKRLTTGSAVVSTANSSNATSVTLPISIGSSSVAKTAIQKALEQIEDAEDKVDDMSSNSNSAEDDLVDARAYFYKAIKFYLSTDYTKAKSYADDAFDSAEDAYGLAGGKTEKDEIDDRIDEIDKLIGQVHDKINDADDDGEDVSEAEDLLDDARDLLNKAEDYLDDKEYDIANDSIDDAESKAEDAEDAIRDNKGDKSDAEDAIAEAKAAIRSAKATISDAQDDDEDTDTAEDLLNDAEDLFDEARTKFDNDDFADAESLAKKAERKAEDAEDEL
jgi:peptidoglycan hydrolase-like protein with peptidoglycan-binding domain